MTTPVIQEPFAVTEERRLLAAIGDTEEQIMLELDGNEHRETARFRELRQQSVQLQREFAVLRNPALATVLT